MGAPTALSVAVGKFVPTQRVLLTKTVGGFVVPPGGIVAGQATVPFKIGDGQAFRILKGSFANCVASAPNSLFRTCESLTFQLSFAGGRVLMAWSGNYSGDVLDAAAGSWASVDGDEVFKANDFLELVGPGGSGTQFEVTALAAVKNSGAAAENFQVTVRALIEIYNFIGSVS